MLTALEHELQMVAVSGIYISQTPGACRLRCRSCMFNEADAYITRLLPRLK